jgi:hypothetical protein
MLLDSPNKYSEEAERNKNNDPMIQNLCTYLQIRSPRGGRGPLLECANSNKENFLNERTLLSQFPNLTNHSLFAIINSIATLQCSNNYNTTQSTAKIHSGINTC